MDDLSQGFTDQYNQREDELNRRILSTQKRLAELQMNAGGVSGQPQQMQPQQQSLMTSQDGQKIDTDTSYTFGEHVSEIVPAIASGAMKAVSNVAESLDELWDWAGENWEPLNELHSELKNVPLSDESQYQLPQIKLDTNTGKIVETGTQFLTVFLPMTQGLKAVGMGGKLTQIAAGATADYAAFAPNSGRLADAVQSLAPELKIPVVSYLTTNETDTDFEARMKNVVDGALGGAVVGSLGDVFMKSIKALKGTVTPEMASEMLDQAASRRTLAESVADHNARAEAGRTVAGTFEQGRFFTQTPDEVADDIGKRLLAGEDFTKVADQINFDYLENGDQLRNIVNSLSEKMPELLKRGGFNLSHNWDDVIKEAKKDLEMNGFDLSAKMQKTTDAVKNLDTHVFVMKELHAASSKRLDDLANTIMTSGGSPEDLVRFKRQMLIQGEIQSMVKGTSSAIGRALNAHKMVHAGTMVPKELLDMSLNASGGSELVRDIAKRFSAITDPAAKTKFIAEASKATTLDKVQFYWINSLLSSPTTWVINATSNLGVVANTVLESTVAATRNAVKGEGDITFGAVGDQLAGMWHGLTDAVKISAEAMRAMGRFATNGDTAALKETLGNPENVGTAWQSLVKQTSAIDPTQASKFDYDLDPQNAKNMSGFIGKATQLLNGVIGTPGRVLLATDELFKTIHYRGYMHMQASITGRKEGLKGAELQEYITNYLTNPLTKDHKEALNFAKYGTFQNDLGKAGRGLQTIVREVPLTRFVMPFVRTPTNIIKYAIHHSPFMAYPGFRKLSTQMSEDIAAGGVRKELAEAKVATGSMLFAVAGLMAANGILTGGADKEYKDGTAALIGKQEYSIKIGDRQYSFSRLDPFGMFFGVTADMYELASKMDEREWSETAGGLILAFSNNLANKTYLKGLIDFSDAILKSNGSASKTEKWLTSFATSFIPNFMNQTNRIHIDNQLKEVSSFMDAVKARVYGLSQEVAPRRDPITGEIKTTSDGLLGGYLPIYNQEVKDDPLLHELYTIGYKPTALPDTLISKSREGKADIKLSGAEKDRLHVLYTQEARIGGRNLQEFLREMIQSPGYQRLPDTGPEQYGTDSKVKRVQEVVTRFRNVGKKMLIRESASVNSKISSRLMELVSE